MLKLSSSEIVNIKLQLEEQSQNEHILEQLKMGEQPDAGGMAPPAEGGETDVDEDVDDDNDDSA